MEHQRFDTAAKELIWEDPDAWVGRFGDGPPGRVEVIESEATTLTATADKVLKVLSDPPYLVNIELQSSHESDLVRTLWMRQTALDYRHGLPVMTVLVLLRKEANSPSLTGEYERRLPDGVLTNRYHYRVVRVWREPPEAFLESGLALTPLAPLAAVREEELPGLVRRMADRINREPPIRANKLWVATYLLMGLRYPKELALQLLEGVGSMRESTTYQAILNEGLEMGLEKGRSEGRMEGRSEGRMEGRMEGRLEGRSEGRLEGRSEGRLEGRAEGRSEEARILLRRQGGRRFGSPTLSVLQALEAIEDLDRLEALCDRVVDHDVTSWDQLLENP